MGGSNPTPFCTPFEIQECDFEENVSHMLENVEANEVLVTLTHTPPFGVLDMVGDTHVGCKALKVFLDRADLMICGHIHEARGIERSGKTIIVNPGMAALGFAAIIDIDIENNKTNIDVKLIESDREVN